MPTCDQQFEQLMIDLKKANDDVIALKAQVNMFRQVAIDLFNGGWDEHHMLSISGRAREAFDSTPEQCLNSVKCEAYRKGFMASGEGYNGEHGADEADIKAEVNDYLRELEGNTD